MEKLISEQIVDSILSQDTDAFVGAFNAAIAAKVTDALEVKKVEIASSLITPEMAVEEEVEQVDEAFRLFHPGKKAIIKNIDKHGFTGRENHPPTDGSLDGHTIRITDYGDATGKHGVTSGIGGPRYQAVRGKVLTGKHKGKEFEFIQHELKHAEDVKEEVEQIDEETPTVSAYHEVMSSHHESLAQGRDALAKGRHEEAIRHFMDAGRHLKTAGDRAEQHFRTHGTEINDPKYPGYSPYIINWGAGNNVKEEAEQIDEKANDALANELLGFEAAKGEKVKGREQILNAKSNKPKDNAATAAISNVVRGKVKAKLNKVNTQPVMQDKNDQGK